jgi:hypothetical protein
LKASPWPRTDAAVAAFPPVTDFDAAAKDITATGFSVALKYDGSIHGHWIAVGPELLYGTVTPNYIVLTVVYAPPGTNNGNSKSLVEYGSGAPQAQAIPLRSSTVYRLKEKAAFLEMVVAPKHHLTSHILLPTRNR